MFDDHLIFSYLFLNKGKSDRQIMPGNWKRSTTTTTTTTESTTTTVAVESKKNQVYLKQNFITNLYIFCKI